MKYVTPKIGFLTPFSFGELFKDLFDQAASTLVNVAKIVKLHLFLEVSEVTHIIHFFAEIFRKIERKFFTNFRTKITTLYQL